MAKRKSPEALAGAIRKGEIAMDSDMTRELLRLYRSATKGLYPQLTDIIAKMVKAREDGLPISQDWVWQRARLGSVLRDISSEMETFGLKTGRVVSTRKAIYAQEGLASARKLLGAVNAGFGGVPPKLGAAFVSRAADGKPLADLFKGYGPASAQAAKDALFTSIIGGDGPRKAQKAVRVALQTTRNHALTIARTETNTVRRRAATAHYVENRSVVLRKRWACAFQRRTCPMCLAMDGREFPIEEEMATHPNCRCTWIPITRLSRPPSKTGAEWLSEQDPETQEAIMGHAGAELYRTGKVKLPDFIQRTTHERWGAGRRERSLKKMRELEIISREDIAKASLDVKARRAAARAAAGKEDPVQLSKKAKTKASAHKIRNPGSEASRL